MPETHARITSKRINLNKRAVREVKFWKEEITESGKTITLGRGIGLSICMSLGTGTLALLGLARVTENAHEAILSWLQIIFVTIPRAQTCFRSGPRNSLRLQVLPAMQRKWSGSG